ncbi:diguanylate cyclase [Halomonas sp. GT]|uniref:diguanylate cyclase n=1 Tax=Halomonas sp. GT TaxID=1971364 RepID=UPI0022B61EBC|nr:diguanylate cyclase [Halomonas sp. GT]
MSTSASRYTAYQPTLYTHAGCGLFQTDNDDFGHDAGDAVLVEISRLLRQHLRDLDVICRFGGEEFVALLPETSRIAAESRQKRYCYPSQRQHLLIRITAPANNAFLRHSHLP